MTKPEGPPTQTDLIPVHPEASSELRRRGLGSSDAPVIAGLTKQYRSRYQLHLEKRGLLDRSEAGEAAYWGTMNEPTILRHHAKETETWILGRSDWEDTYSLHCPDGRTQLLTRDNAASIYKGVINILDELWHADIEYMVVHLDGIAVDSQGHIERFVEAKTAGEWMKDKWGRMGTDEIPDEYLIQVQHALEVTRSHGLEYPCDVVALIGGNRCLPYEVEHNPRLVKVLLKLEAEFWLEVQEEIIPDPDGSAYTSQILQEMYPKTTGETKEVLTGSTTEQMVREYRRAQLREKEAKEETATFRNRIKDNMGKVAKLQGGNWSISWTPTKEKNIIDWEAAIVEFRNALAYIESELGGDGLDVPAVLAMLDEASESQTTFQPSKRHFHPTLHRMALLPPPTQGD